MKAERGQGGIARRRQCGAVLIIGLILLVVMAMIGMTGMQTTTQQERMAGNLRDRNVGFQSAETALRAGEAQVRNNTLPPYGGGFYDSAEGVPPPSDNLLKDDTTWVAANKVTTAPVHGTAAAPEYIIERRPAVSGGGLGAGEAKTKNIFKITARGVGASVNSAVVVQSTFSQ